MAWSIAIIENTLIVPESARQELFEAGEAEEIWWEPSDVLDRDGHLQFNMDAMEHMDYLHEARIQNIIRKHGGHGTVTFADVEGDNAGTWWSYNFSGKDIYTDGGDIVDAIIRIRGY